MKQIFRAKKSLIPQNMPLIQGEGMKNTRFKVVFTGHLTPGMTRHQVRSNLESLCQFSSQTLDRILSGNTAMRSGVDRKAAWRCWELFRRAGALCTVEPMEPIPSENPVSLVSGSHVSTQLCPCCLTPLDNTITCLFCGVDIAIYNLTSNIPCS